MINPITKYLNTMQNQIFNDTYQKQIAHLFRAGEKLTVLDALKKVGTSELRHFVTELRRAGMDITSNWTKANGKRFKVYSLNKPKTN